MKLILTSFRSIALVSLLLATQILNGKALAEEKGQDKDSLINYKSGICKEDIATAIEEIIELPKLRRSRWGIEVQTEEGDVLYSRNGHKFFTPASSAKLLTTAAVLSALGGEYRLTTPVFATGNVPHLSSLRIKGKGDPSLSTKTLKQIVHKLQALGIKKIDKLIVDDSYFDAPAINPTWEWLDVHSYFATAVNSTILNQNMVTLTLLPQQLGESIEFSWNDRIAGRQWQVINQGITGAMDLPYNIEIDGDLGKPVLQIRGELAINEPPDIWDMAVVDPATYFLESLRFHLAQAGIAVTKGIVVRESYEDELETKLFTISSTAIAEIIREINQESNNLYAEAVAKVLAKELNANNEIEAINLSLKSLGIDSDEYLLIDASGLSRQNLVSPKTLVKILNLMSNFSLSESRIYQQSLAIAGVQGTLKNRFRHSSISGHLWGKTGTLTGVSSLSGYLSLPNSPKLIISVIVNNSELSSQEIRKEIDRIITIVSHIDRC